MPIIFRKKSIYFAVLLAIMFGSIFFVHVQIYGQKGTNGKNERMTIEKGENAMDVGKKLRKLHVINNEYYFVFFLWQVGKLHALVAGTYDFSPGLSIPDAAHIVTDGKNSKSYVSITFPEGITAKDMAEKLDANGFSGSDFLALIANPTDDFKREFPILADLSSGQSLEGFLFPDTYYFKKDASGSQIAARMVANFEEKIQKYLVDIKSQNKHVYDILTMASIVEGEVRTDADRKIVAGLFWNRIRHGQRLQSDATLEYALGTNVFQHTIKETQIDSPYNTYRNNGLPPGPVSNPGISSMEAAIYPESSDYVYFLTDPKTGKTVFAKTYEDHLANKARYGL